jgi:hypothetical protein
MTTTTMDTIPIGDHDNPQHLPGAAVHIMGREVMMVTTTKDKWGKGDEAVARMMAGI